VSQTHDVIVVGLGGLGAAALAHLASRGLKVVGLEQFGIGHARGSSHGGSRIVRLAYFEHPDYVPLARRSLELWHAMQDEGEAALFTTTGGLDGGPADGRIFLGARAACEAHDLVHEVLDGDEVRRRFPALRVPLADQFVWQPDAGSVDPELGIELHVQKAKQRGASVITEAGVVGWQCEPGLATVSLDNGEQFTARHLVMTAGPWTSALWGRGPAHVSAVWPRFTVERQVVGWYDEAQGPHFAPDRLPVYNVEGDGGHFYGFPALGGRGPKLGRFGHLHEVVQPDDDMAEVTRADRELLQGWSDRRLVGAGAVTDTSVCRFTYTNDHHFVVDRVPDTPLVVGCGLSGHGYKFVPALGEVIADLVVGGPAARGPALFAWDRPGLCGPSPAGSDPA
jgi:sarcosine oxidase